MNSKNSSKKFFSLEKIFLIKTFSILLVFSLSLFIYFTTFAQIKKTRENYEAEKHLFKKETLNSLKELKNTELGKKFIKLAKDLEEVSIPLTEKISQLGNKIGSYTRIKLDSLKRTKNFKELISNKKIHIPGEKIVRDLADLLSYIFKKIAKFFSLIATQ